jgi:hypothetical protein
MQLQMSCSISVLATKRVAALGVAILASLRAMFGAAATIVRQAHAKWDANWQQMYQVIPFMIEC